MNHLNGKGKIRLRSNHRRCSEKKVFLKISQSSQEKRLCHRCFPVNFVNFLRTPFFIEHFWTTASKDFDPKENLYEKLFPSIFGISVSVSKRYIKK